MTRPPETPAAPGRYWPLVLCLAAVAGLAPVSIDMYLPSFPAIREEFGATPAQIQATLSVYMLGFTLGQLGYGPLSDRFGRRRVLLSGIAVFVVMTILCAVSWDAESLAAFRFLQAVGGAAGTVLSRAIVRDVYSGRTMARVMSLVLTILLFAPMAAPIIGGHLLVWLGWRSVFWTLAGIGVAAALVTVFGIRESLPPERRAASGPGTLLRGYRAVLSHRRALGYVLSGGVTFGALFAFLSGAPFVFIEFYGVAPQHMGYIFLINLLGVVAGSWLNSRLVLVRGVRGMMTAGVATLFAGAVALFLLVATGTWGMWGAVLGIALFTLPLNVINANAAAGALEYFPYQAGTASAVVGAVRYGCGAAAGWCVGLLHDGTPTAMAAVILGCATISALFLATMVRR